MNAQRIVVVTGGTGELGRTVVDAFLSQGDRVVVVSRSASVGANRENVDRMACDVTHDAAVSTLFSSVVRNIGVPYAIIHTAGGFAGGRSLAETSTETWERMMSLNLRASFLVLREGARALQQGGGGSIVLVTASSPLRGGPGALAYKVSKDAVHAMVRFTADELARDKISVNAVAPSTIDTPDNRNAMPGADTSGWIKPELIASTIVHLTSASGRVISGAILPLP